MSNVIQFLETMGRQPALSPADYAATVAALDFEPAQQQALLASDVSALNSLLEGRSKMFFMVATPERAPSDAPDQDDGFSPDEEEPVDPDRS